MLDVKNLTRAFPLVAIRCIPTVAEFRNSECTFKDVFCQLTSRNAGLKKTQWLSSEQNKGRCTVYTVDFRLCWHVWVCCPFFSVKLVKNKPNSPMCDTFRPSEKATQGNIDRIIMHVYVNSASIPYMYLKSPTQKRRSATLADLKGSRRNQGIKIDQKFVWVGSFLDATVQVTLYLLSLFFKSNLQVK